MPSMMCLFTRSPTMTLEQPDDKEGGGRSAVGITHTNPAQVQCRIGNGVVPFVHARPLRNPPTKLATEIQLHSIATDLPRPARGLTYGI